MKFLLDTDTCIHALKQNERVEGFKVDREYMRGYVNPADFIEEQRKRVEDEKQKAKK